MISIIRLGGLLQPGSANFFEQKLGSIHKVALIKVQTLLLGGVFLTLSTAFFTVTAAQAVSETGPMRQKISDDVFTPYTRSGYGKTFAKFGNRMSDVEKARQAAAFLAASSSKCPWVELSEVATTSTRENIQTFTDCRDKKTDKFERFRFSESELKDKNGKFFTEKTLAAAPSPQTIKDQALSKESALSHCKQTVKNAAKFPSSVRFLDHIVRTSTGSGETWVEIDFEAKNDFGGLLPQKAKCNYPIKDKPTFTVSNR